MINKNRIKHFSLSFLKILIFVATLYYLYFKVISTDKFNDFFHQFTFLSTNDYLIIASVLILMLVNWGIETLKWKFLISKIEDIKFLKAYKAVWSGVTINNWVPNRMAEFLGRIFFITKGNKAKAVFSTLVGNLSNMLITFLFGSIALLFWLDKISILIVILLILLNLLLGILFFNVSIFTILLEKIKWLDKFKKHADILREYNKSELLSIYFYSLIRYLTYAIQYFLLLKAFGIEVNFFTGITGVALIFVIQSVLPAVTFTEIGIRGAVVIFVFEKFSSNFAALLAAAYLLWLINIIIPTIFGGIFILTLKRNNQEKK